LFGVTALALAGGEENIIQPNASLFLVFVLFLIFVFVLNRILFRPIGRVLDEREALTEGATNEARAATRRYQAELAGYEASIRQARGDSYRRLEQERAAALEKRKHLIDEAKQKAAEEIQRAKSEIADQAAAARASLEAESRQIAQRISRTVLGRTLGGGGD
jgi:F-type H+-transporting ATPase subunit b